MSERAAARSLSRVEGNIDILHELICARAVSRRQNYTYARPDRDLMSEHVARGADGREQSLRELLRFSWGLRSCLYDGEFIAPKPRHEIVPPHGLAQ
jgi:hypothetical protein